MFCASLSDWLDNKVPRQWRGDLLKLIEATPDLDWLLLTKRPENAAQGLGLGRRMLQFAERVAVDRGYRYIRLYTNEAMAENIALYSRIGYSEMHRAVENGLRRLHMAKPFV